MDVRATYVSHISLFLLKRIMFRNSDENVSENHIHEDFV